MSDDFRLAFVSPMPPKHSGIAEYSDNLLAAFSTYWPQLAVDVFDDIETDSTTPSVLPVKPILPLLFEKKRRQPYQQFIYHIGNNPGFHSQIRHLAALQPGIVVLHDTVLYFLMAGYGHGGLWQAMANSGIVNARDQVNEVERQSLSRNLLKYRYPEQLPLLNSILANAREIVVHSQTAALNVLACQFKGPVHIVPLLQYAVPPSSADQPFSHETLERVRQEKQYHGTIVIGLFGFGGATKRAKSLFTGLNNLPAALRNRIRLIIVGTDLYNRDAEDTDIADRTAVCGYVSDQDYDNAMQLCDIVVNLRYPSMGETSAVQIQAMSAGKATLVSDHGWFAELPDDVVAKIPVDDSEIPAITSTVMQLIEQPESRQHLEQQSLSYVQQFHNPETVVRQWRSFLSS